MQLPIEKVITQFRVRYLGLFYLSREKKDSLYKNPSEVTIQKKL